MGPCVFEHNDAGIIEIQTPQALTLMKMPDICDSNIQLGYVSGEVTYNFGLREFLVRVMISDGKIERTEKLGYGFVESEDRPLEEYQSPRLRWLSNRQIPPTA